MTNIALIPNTIQSKYITIDDIKIHYLESGKGEVVLMIHGFPTSAYLWRNVMEKPAQSHRVIAIDLPGYGDSDKPLKPSYSLKFYNGIITKFLDKLAIKHIHLAVHDLGGPIGIHWATRNKERISSLVLMNTLVYPKFSWAVILFTLCLKLPLIKGWISSPSGIAWGMKFGVQNTSNINTEVKSYYQKPYFGKEARKVLLKSASNISIKGFKEIEKELPKFTIPVRVIYGINDRILPNVAKTMNRIKEDLPQTRITAIQDCGHFLQEDKPEEVAELLVDFLLKVE